MLWTNFKIATVLFFGWFIADSVSSIILTNPLDGIYYPAASGQVKSTPGDWTQKPWFGAPLYLLIFSGIWAFVVRKEGRKGFRIAAIITSFVMAPFWIVSVVSADMYNLAINKYWLACMIYSNISFLLFGFIGTGKLEDLHL